MDYNTVAQSLEEQCDTRTLRWFRLACEYLHQRINEQRFRQMIYSLLAATGLLLIAQTL